MFILNVNFVTSPHFLISYVLLMFPLNTCRQITFYSGIYRLYIQGNMEF